MCQLLWFSDSSLLWFGWCSDGVRSCDLCLLLWFSDSSLLWFGWCGDGVRYCVLGCVAIVSALNVQRFLALVVHRVLRLCVVFVV